ncbi:MAG: type IV toxin-antitoxin system AbiEi family antitoxin domain-containing protein [Nakamurella sp.]
MIHRQLDARIKDLFDVHGDVITLGDADASGVPRDALRRAAGGHLLERVGRGTFVRSTDLEGADQWEQYRLRSIGFILGIAPDVHLCGPSAQAVLRMPSVIDPPSLPMARRPGPAHRGPDRTPIGRIRTGHLPEVHQWTRDRARVTSMVYTTVDAIRYASADEALVIVDHALRHGATRDQLVRLALEMENYPGIHRVLWAIEHGDPRAESALESLGRLAFIEAGRPAPLSNVWIFDHRRAARVDHLLPGSGVVIEGDGGLKVNNRPDAHRVIDAQVDRERWLRSIGYLVERYNYSTGRYHREKIVRRADLAVLQRGDRPVPTGWSMERPAWI